eukprot:403368693
MSTQSVHKSDVTNQTLYKSNGQHQLLSSSQRIDISPVLHDDGSNSVRVNKTENGKNLFDHRGYISFIAVLSLFYFFDVFIGMLMLHREYEKDGAFQFERNERNYSLTDRPYDLIELILLIIIVIEIIGKSIFSTKSQQQKTVIGKKEIALDILLSLLAVALLLANQNGGLANRRFSKTQKNLTYDQGIESSVINSWISQIFNNNAQNSKHQDNISSDGLLVDPRQTFTPGDYSVKEIMDYEEQINSNNFNAFDLHRMTKQNSLYFMLQYTFQKFEMQSSLKFDPIKFQTLSLKLQATYRSENHYHTAIHAADVVQNVYFYCIHQGGNSQEMCKLNAFEMASLFISSAAHDVDHPGNNNVFETKTRSKLALLYNDQAVLENHHAATFFFLIDGDEQCNVFDVLSSDDYNKMRKHIVDNILYTDMTKHFQFMGEIKAMPGKEDFDPSAAKYKPDIMKALVHAADIGNPARPYELCKIWAFKILSEFFAQGDKERQMGLDITLLCDRKTTNVSKSQIGFIDFVVLPYFDAIAKILPQMEYSTMQLRQNKEQWVKHIDEYESQREKNGNENI